MLIDEQGTTGTAFGFKAVPNGVLIDADGTVQWAKYGGFSVDNADDLAVVQRFFAGDAVDPYAQTDYPYQLTDNQSAEVAQLVRDARSHARDGRTADAVRAWRQALDIDPENLVIRKQIWEAEHPEKFHPVIDKAWQQVQLQAERADEVARGVCGPDGCPLPPRG